MADMLTPLLIWENTVSIGVWRHELTSSRQKPALLCFEIHVHSHWVDRVFLRCWEDLLNIILSCVCLIVILISKWLQICYSCTHHHTLIMLYTPYAGNSACILYCTAYFYPHCSLLWSPCCSYLCAYGSSCYHPALYEGGTTFTLRYCTQGHGFMHVPWVNQL